MSKEFDTEYTDEIVCPYCGEEQGDSLEYQDDDIGLIECACCDKEFYAQRDIRVTYCTEKPVIGTCSCCGKENVVVEDYASTIMKRENIGVHCCLQKEKEIANKLYMEKLQNRGKVL